MELFNEAKGYATRKTAMQKLAKVLPQYEEFRFTVVALSSGRYLPIVQLTGSNNQWLIGALAGEGIGVM